MTLPMRPDALQAEAIAEARRFIAARIRGDWHSVASVVLTAAGARYIGMNLDSTLPRASICAEPVAIGMAMDARYAVLAGILPAPEANHAVKGAVVEALRCKEEGVSETILFNLCGHGHFDMQAYSDFASGKLYDQPYDESEVAMTLAGLPSVA